jgi:ribosome-binding protein aMBF1 (putative translation factor)
MINVNKLKGKIVEKGLSVEQLAEQMQINKSTLYRKLASGGELFTIKEANMIAKILELDFKEVNDIFLIRVSRNMRQK